MEKIKEKEYDLLDMCNGKWYTVNEEYLGQTVLKFGEIEELQIENKGKTLVVTYNNGDLISFTNIHGTWGFPTTLQ